MAHIYISHAFCQSLYASLASLIMNVGLLIFVAENNSLDKSVAAKIFSAILQPNLWATSKPAH